MMEKKLIPSISINRYLTNRCTGLKAVLGSHLFYDSAEKLLFSDSLFRDGKLGQTRAN